MSDTTDNIKTTSDKWLCDKCGHEFDECDAESR